MVNAEINSGQRVDQSNLSLYQEVGSFPLKLFVWLLINDDDDVAGLGAWEFVRFAVEGVLISVGCAFVDVNFNDLLLLRDLLSIAGLALEGVIDNFTLAMAVVTWSLRLSVHAWSELLHLHDHTPSFALWALLNCAFLASLTATRLADALSVDGDFGLLAVEEFFECTLHLVFDRLHLLGTGVMTTSSSTAEHLTEDVTSTCGPSLLDSLLSVLIVEVSLLLVADDVPGILNLLELFFVTTWLVWVMLGCQFTVVLSDYIVRVGLLTVKSLIEGSGVHRFSFSGLAHSWEASEAASEWMASWEIVVVAEKHVTDLSYYRMFMTIRV